VKPPTQFDIDVHQLATKLWGMRWTKDEGLRLAREIITLVDSAKECSSLASWHFDPDADETNPSPEDMVAHVNGLIVSKLDNALKPWKSNA